MDNTVIGLRRPGYALSIEPGFQYVHGKSVFSAEIGRAIHRDRTRRVPDRLTGAHGDAAFADSVWLASYSYRFPSHRDHAKPHNPDIAGHTPNRDAM